MLKNNHVTPVKMYHRIESFYKFWGILMMIILGIYAVAIVFGLLGAVVGAMWFT